MREIHLPHGYFFLPMGGTEAHLKARKEKSLLIVLVIILIENWHLEWKAHLLNPSFCHVLRSWSDVFFPLGSSEECNSSEEFSDLVFGWLSFVLVLKFLYLLSKRKKKKPLCFPAFNL